MGPFQAFKGAIMWGQRTGSSMALMEFETEQQGKSSSTE